METSKKSTVEILQKLLSDSQKKLLENGIIAAPDMGSCVYPDVNNPGDTLCGDNWSAAMCAYAGGAFTPGGRCQ